ncbi:DUF1294 domain-containing protein [Asticcacaulis sp. 201]|uniref:DUF1294 domain-containing protein n=1 Tax=Asticcacaulis sp. 201 TaxID=3028787 RepID=UPI0039833EBB
MFWLFALAFLCLINLATWHAWAMDKKYALAGKRRIRETTLLWLCAAGGWPLGLLASQVFRHKRSKKAFMHKLYGAAAFHAAIVCLIGLIW